MENKLAKLFVVSLGGAFNAVPSLFRQTGDVAKQSTRCVAQSNSRLAKRVNEKLLQKKILFTRRRMISPYFNKSTNTSLRSN